MGSRTFGIESVLLPVPIHPLNGITNLFRYPNIAVFFE
jgi:hypothetical protein